MQVSPQQNVLSLSLHKVGNKGEGEPLKFSKRELEVDENISRLLNTYFLSPFKSEEYYQFYHDSDISLNEVFTYVSAIFDDPEALQEQSVNLAKHLYNQSTHPKIKGGEFYVVYFKACGWNGMTMDAVGLFKSENKDTFLKIHPREDYFELESDEGININKLDKGCMIFNNGRDEGYMVSIVDNTNRGNDAQYWIDDFLQVRQRADQYFNTETTLSVYKDFITRKLPEDFELSKADQADLLNRSIRYFKEKEEFEIKDFTDEVLHFPEFVDGFNNFRKTYGQERDIEIADAFSISDAAVKRQSRNYKSVIKLDKNFHIYVHGDRNLIELGEDDKGRFYKVYFEKES